MLYFKAIMSIFTNIILFRRKRDDALDTCIVIVV